MAAPLVCVLVPPVLLWIWAGLAGTFFGAGWLRLNGSFDPPYVERFWDLANGQDFRACEGVQRGISSCGFVPGPFDYRESGVYALQAMVARAYLTGELERPAAWT